MYNDNKTPLEKAVGILAITKNPDEAEIKRVADVYGLSVAEVKKNMLVPVKISGRVRYFEPKRASEIQAKMAERKQWSIRKSAELRRSHILPGTYTNKKHARNAESGGAAPPEDLDSKQMRRKVVSELSDSRKSHIQAEWEKLTSH